MTDLKPCPFCGEEAQVSWWIIDSTLGKAYPELYQVACPFCAIEFAYEDKADAIAAWNRRASGWISVEERLPEPGVPVLVFVNWLREDGERFTRRLRAQWSDGKSLPVDPTCDGFGVYDEEADEFLCPEGWFETNEYEDTHWQIGDPVTHWQPLPEPPEVT